jgi:hypothetical protein
MNAPTEAKPNRLWWFFSLVPWIWLALLVSIALHLRVGLGYWPRPVLDNYTSGGFSVHFVTVALIGVFSLASVAPISIGLVIMRTSPFQPLIYCLGWLCIVGFCKYDPTRFVTWLLD